MENYTKIWNKNIWKRKFAGMPIQAVAYCLHQNDGNRDGHRTLQEIMGHGNLTKL